MKIPFRMLKTNSVYINLLLSYREKTRTDPEKVICADNIANFLKLLLNHPSHISNEFRLIRYI